MSSVPYTFANNTGNIPLSELDANFANVKSSVDFAFVAGQAAVATTAFTVTGSAQSSITSVGTLTNLNVNGTISAGNVTANYFIGDGSQLTNLPSLNYSNANVAAYLPTYTGNLAGALISVTGNTTTGNVLTTGIVSAVGEVTGASLLTSGNVAAGNVFTGGVVSAAGNTTAGNVLTAGIVSASGNVRGSNFNTSGIISATGNITSGNYILGNVALADGLPPIYTDSNVVSLLSAFGSNVVNTTGNIYGGNISANSAISATGNVVGGNITTLGIVSGVAVEATNIIAADVNSNAITGPSFLSYIDTTLTAIDTVSLGAGGVISVQGLEQYDINYIRITANATSANLSSTISTNIIQANNTGYTANIVFPSDYPVGEGTVVRFTVAGGNAVTLIGDGGNLAIVPSFDGLTSVGTGYAYMLVLEPFTSGYWARVV